ncbi:MAG: class I SAM-dependent methyltransferase [Fidelibacterota bacterium]
MIRIAIARTVLPTVILAFNFVPCYAPPTGAHAGPFTQQTPPQHDSQHRFKDAEKWAERFENPERDQWQKPEEVIDILSFQGDETVVDIGSGTGYFSVRFAKVLPRGKVYGADIEPDMVRYLNERAKKEDLPNLSSRLVDPDDPGISEPVDVVFLCNTYHHIQDRVDYFGRLREDFRPGGRLVIVDFVKGDLPVGPPDHMKLSPEAVISELSQAGYTLTQSSDVLPYQYILIFVLPAE